MFNQNFFNEFSTILNDTLDSNIFKYPELRGDDGTYEIDLPAVKKEDLKIKTVNRELYISGKYSSKLKNEDFEYKYTINNVSNSKIKASLNNGVLTLKFQKEKPTDINID